MASTLAFVEYACEQMSQAGTITYKKMFGEYGVYCEGKIIGLICDEQLFIKKTDEGLQLLEEVSEGSPYPGAKSHFVIESLDDKEALGAFVRATYEALPMPKPKKPKKPKVKAEL